MLHQICNLTLIVVTLMGGVWSPKLEAKIKSTVTKTYNVERYRLRPVDASPSMEENTPKQVKDCLFTVYSSERQLGYIYVGQAPSMKNVFDYIVLFDTDLKVVNAKILIYRERHGRQIGTKRWLKQFFGLQSTDTPVLGKNIDGISGATISATSMTDAVRSVLTTVNYLKEHQQIRIPVRATR